MLYKIRVMLYMIRMTLGLIFKYWQKSSRTANTKAVQVQWDPSPNGLKEKVQVFTYNLVTRIPQALLPHDFTKETAKEISTLVSLTRILLTSGFLDGWL